jgi:biotin carboxyl carrier protein
MYNVQISDEVDQQILKMNLKSKKTNLLLELKAPMPGVVRQVHFKNGDAVVKGDALIILEAMKMENVLRAPFDGIVGEISVKPGEAVEKNQLLLRFH